MALTRDGGKPNVKSLPYATPQGPTEQMRRAVGLGGDNLGKSGTQGSYTNPSESGSPGLHGDTRGNKGSQR